MRVCSFGSGALLRGALAVLVAAMAAGCGGGNGSGGDGGSGAGSNPPNPTGGSGGNDCPNYTVDCLDPCGWFVAGYCENGQWKCPTLSSDCPTGGSGGGGNGGSGGAGDPPAHPAEWSHGYGDAGDYQGGEAIAAGPNGEAVIAFAFGGTLDLGGGPLVNAVPDEMYDMDIALAKLDAAGTHVWSKSFGSADRQTPTDIAVDAAGNIYLAGHFMGELDFGQGPLTGPLFVAKLDPDGNPLWSRGFAGENEVSLAIHPSGGVVLAMDCKGGVDLGAGPLSGQGKGDVCVVALDDGGGHVWSQLYGGPEYDRVFDIAVGPGGEIALTGMFQATLLLSDPLESKGGFDAFVAGLAPDGAPLWARSYGDVEKDGAASVVWSPDGPVVTGWFSNTVDFGGGPLGAPGLAAGFVLWLDPEGAHRKSRMFKGMISNLSGAERWSLALEPSGGAVLAGQFQQELVIGDSALPCAGGEDVGLVRFSSEGDLVWAYGYGTFFGELTGSVAVAGSGDILLTGSFYSDVDFGAGALDGAGNGDAFVASFPLDSAAP